MSRETPAVARPQTPPNTSSTTRRKPAKKKVSEQTQTELRDELFADGSEFKSTTREEIVGIDNVLGEIDEVIHWLKHSREYQKYGSRLQPGILFEGKPGTGKTLVSRYIATASDALFINVRDFAHKDSLFSDADIRDLFRRSRKLYKDAGRPVVLFWDEFENAAVERGDCTPDQAATVSQLTAELDGIHGKNEGILLIGCTNYINDIDHALRRRGRMGVHIEFHAPDRPGKQKILTHYLSTMKTVGEIDADMLSYFFDRDATAADIEEACVEAWRVAVRRCLIDGGSEPVLAEQDLVEVFIKQLVGPPTTFTLPDNEALQVAVHECGHAIAALIFERPLRLVTVQPGKKSYGRVMTDDIQQYVSPISEYLASMRVALGSISAERVAGLDPLVGATGDIAKVTQYATFLVEELGVNSSHGLLNLRAMNRGNAYSSLIPQYSNELVLEADQDAAKLVDALRLEVQAAMEAVGQDAIWEVAQEVFQRVTMTGAEFSELFYNVVGKDATEFQPADLTTV